MVSGTYLIQICKLVSKRKIVKLLESQCYYPNAKIKNAEFIDILNWLAELGKKTLLLWRVLIIGSKMREKPWQLKLIGP